MEVLGSAVLSICDEMNVVLTGSARSPLLRESGDFACTLHSADGQLIAQTNTIPPLASLARDSVRSLGKFVDIEGQVRDGDIYFTNHLDVGGSHLSDVKAMAPLFYGGQIVAWVANCAHWPDIGGAFASGYVAATEIYQEGILIPPVRFFRGNQLQREVVDLVLNNVRAPDERLGDIRAQEAAIRRGKARLTEMIEKYGLSMMQAFFEVYLDYTEVVIRREIEQIPNGIYEFEDFMDSDGITDDPVRLHVKVTVDDDRMSFDFSESDAQVRGPINATPWTVWAGVNFAVQGITGASVPINEGVYRPLEVFIPKGCWLNARHPAPRQHSTHETGHRVVDCVLGALAKAVPDRVPAALHGTSSIMIMTGDDGRVAPPEHFMFFECVAGGFGGRPTMDGIDGIRTGMGNAINVSAEFAEAEFSLVTERYEFATDSGGPGKYRGGCGLQRIMKVDGDPNSDVLCISAGERSVGRPYGLHGGKPGEPGHWAAIDIAGNESPLKGKDNRWLKRGERFSSTAPGGGGWGDPFDRAPETVLEDVVEEKVSLASAISDYGVAIRPDTLDIDWEETRQLRSTVIAETVAGN